MTSDVATPVDAIAEWTDWNESRRASVTGPLGSLSLVLTQWSASGVPPVDDAEARSGHPEDAVLTRLTRTDIDTGEPQHGYRIWRADAPARAAFEEIESYDYDPDLVVEGHFELVDEERVVPFEHLKDAGGTREHIVSGDLVFTWEGREYRLAALDTTDGERALLQLVFGDPTNGSETYGAGRFLFLERPATEAIGEGQPVVIDFNRAIVPPCGFSNQMNCPLPPLQNRLGFPVRAGEKRVRYAEGFTL